MPPVYTKATFCISITVCFLVTQCSASNSGWNSASLKRKLPKPFEYDDFDECRAANLNFQYCVLQAVIQPDESSEIWRNISIFSSDSRNFPRDHLERGLCLHKCLPPDTNVDLLFGLNISRDDDRRLAHTLDQCVNKALHRSHNLYASTTILQCLSEEDLGRPLSTGEMTFIGLVIILVLAIGWATFCEVPFTGALYHSLIAPFSLPRNINQLLNITTSNGTSGGNLRCLEGLRAIFMLIILVVHSSLPSIRMPLKNPEDFELQTNSFIFPFVNSGNTHMITFFFAIGGMVQVVSFFNSVQKLSHDQVGVGFFCRKVLHRLARLLPAYAFVIFYQATLFPRTKPTPIAHKFIDYCDRHWWSNVLFINNFVHLDEPCLKFGWYLGADFQLFLIGLASMVFIWRFPRAKKFGIGLMVSVALVVPAYVIYREKLDATMGFNMRHALTELRAYNEFLKYYTLTSINAGTYFFGMIAGLLYHHISKNNLQTSAQHYTSKLFSVVLVAFVSLNGFLVLLPSLPQAKPSLFLAIFGTALRAIWGLTHGTLFLLLVFKRNSIVVAFLEHPALRVLARLSYSIYIVQYSVIYMIYSNLAVPFTYGAINSLFVISAIMFITFISGLLLHVAVELPCGTILKWFIDGKMNLAGLTSLRPKKA